MCDCDGADGEDVCIICACVICKCCAKRGIKHDVETSRCSRTRQGWEVKRDCFEERDAVESILDSMALRLK